MRVPTASLRVLKASTKLLTHQRGCSRINQGAGTRRAPASRVRDFRELVCWQLAHQLKCEIFELTATGKAATDFDFRNQIRDSSASATRNISEGFGRFRPGDFARYLEIARASLFETRNNLIDGHDRGYWPWKTCERLSNLANAAERLTTRLMLQKQRQARTEPKRTRYSREKP
jgi:four helix bundle protein